MLEFICEKSVAPRRRLLPVHGAQSLTAMSLDLHRAIFIGGEYRVDPFRQKSLLLFILLAFYCASPWLIFLFGTVQITFWPAHKIDESLLLNVVKELSSDPGKYANIIHQMIVPTVAAITAASGADLLKSRAMSFLFLLPLATIFVCLVDALLFNVASVLTVAEAAQERGIITQFFVNIAGNLAVYVMMLVGLKMAEK